MTATLTRAEFLKARERSVVAVGAGVKAAWGVRALETAQSSVLALEAAAAAEAARQLALLGQPLALDAVEIEGAVFDLEGETVRVNVLKPDGSRYFDAAADEVDLLVVRSRIDTARGVTRLEGFVRL